MFGIQVITAPTTEPLSLDEAKAHLRSYATNHEDDLIRALITAAREYCETWTGKSFVTRTLRLTRDAFPCYRDGYQFRLPRPPLLAVTNIQYTDFAGATQTVDSATYVVDPSLENGRIGLAYGESWPTDAIEQLGSVKVNYTAGYGEASAVPKSVKQAMLLLIGHWFINREAAVTGTIQTTTEMAVSALLGANWSGQLTADFG